MKWQKSWIINLVNNSLMVLSFCRDMSLVFDLILIVMSGRERNANQATSGSETA